MKEKYITPTTSTATVLEHFCVQASDKQIESAKSTDAVVATPTTSGEADAWGDAKEWKWEFDD